MKAKEKNVLVTFKLDGRKTAVICPTEDIAKRCYLALILRRRYCNVRMNYSGYAKKGYEKIDWTDFKETVA